MAKGKMSSIKDQIRQEIERRREKWLAESRLIRKGKDKAMYAAGKSSAYDEFLSFIDSLPDECLADERKTSDEPVIDSHGLEEEIQKAIDKYPLNKEDMSEDDIATYHQGLIFGARHFAEWQKEQMMKEAVEGEIGYWNQTGLSILPDKSLERLGYNESTRVKIIIVKEDD